VEFRETQESRAYRKCPERLLQWIWFLYCCWLEYLNAWRDQDLDTNKAYRDISYSASAICDLAFLTPDPNLKMRITARQLVSLISTSKEPAYYKTLIKTEACRICRAGAYVGVSTIPQHSMVKSRNAMGQAPEHREDALTTKFYLAGKLQRKSGSNIICGGSKLNREHSLAPQPEDIM